MESDCDHPSEMEARLDDRWLRPEEICEVLQNPNSTFTEMPAIMPPSGSIYLFNKKKQKGFRNDHYTWKKAKKGRFKEGHEKLKVKGVDALHCYYAHREDDNEFQRRIYWLIDKNLSHIVLVHYRDVKIRKTGKGVLPSRETDASAYNHQASSGLPPVPGLQHEIASFQHPQATNATNLISAQTSEPENTVSDPSNWEGFENLFTGPSDLNDFFDMFPGEDTGIWANMMDNDTGICTNSRASSSAAVEPSHSSLGKRKCDSTKSQATPLATIEGVDEEEEGNDTNQARKRLKVTCGQKSQPPVPQPTATIGIATSSATNMTAAPESSNPALLQSRPTSDASQDVVQDVENHGQELEPTSIELENGKRKAVGQNDFGTGKSHEFSEIAVMGSCKSLHQLLDRVSAPNTLASSSISTLAIDSQAIATIITILEMDFTTMAGDVQRTDKISIIKSFIESRWFPTGSRTMILSILKQLEQHLPAYSEYDKGKNLNDQVEAKRKCLQPKVESCDSMKRELQELEKSKMQIEAKQAAIRAKMEGAVKETEQIKAELKELLPQRDQFKEIEGNLKTSLDIGDGFWTTLQKTIFIFKERFSVYQDVFPLYQAEPYSEYEKVQFCNSKEREFQELAKWKMSIEVRPAAILAEIHGAVKETEPIQAQLEKLLLLQDQFKENEGNLKTQLGYWRWHLDNNFKDHDWAC